MNLNPFINLASHFKKAGFSLWMIGGTTRDYLLKRPTEDFDVVTNATPIDMQKFLPQGQYRYAHYGFVQIQFEAQRFDITTLRQEKGYQDLRHPQSIRFVQTPEEDYPRRDFTINALYMDSTLNLLDFTQGLTHLKEKLIVMIGDPYQRLQEDPLRILRAIRFQHLLEFTLDASLKKIIDEHLHLLQYLNRDKIKEEIRKMMKVRPAQAQLTLMAYGLKELL
jgi:tRNA nucleotidyltransferase (CCA-adding enzyme)